MKAAFHNVATIFGYVQAGLFAGPIQQFFDWHEENGPATELESRIVSIDLIETIATVRIALDDWKGDRFTDLFTLLKVDGDWKIMIKVFHLHAETSGLRPQNTENNRSHSEIIETRSFTRREENERSSQRKIVGKTKFRGLYQDRLRSSLQQILSKHLNDLTQFCAWIFWHTICLGGFAIDTLQAQALPIQNLDKRDTELDGNRVRNLKTIEGEDNECTNSNCRRSSNFDPLAHGSRVAESH